jgi:hypothetical protein
MLHAGPEMGIGFGARSEDQHQDSDDNEQSDQENDSDRAAKEFQHLVSPSSAYILERGEGQIVSSWRRVATPPARFAWNSDQAESKIVGFENRSGAYVCT